MHLVLDLEVSKVWTVKGLFLEVAQFTARKRGSVDSSVCSHCFEQQAWRQIIVAIIDVSSIKSEYTARNRLWDFSIKLYLENSWTFFQLPTCYFSKKTDQVVGSTAMPMRTCRNLLDERIFTTLHSSLELSRLKTKSEPTQRSYLRCLHASKTFTLIQFSEQTVSHFSQLVTPYCAKPWSCLNISWLL